MPIMGVLTIGPRLRVPVPGSAACRAQQFASTPRRSKNASRLGQRFPSDQNECWLTSSKNVAITDILPLAAYRWCLNLHSLNMSHYSAWTVQESGSRAPGLLGFF